MPNRTLYVHNLNERLPLKFLTPDLYNLFNKFGDIESIKARKSKSKRGQAFINYKHEDSAINALNELNETQFYDKILHIEYARNKSESQSNPEQQQQQQPNRQHEDLSTNSESEVTPKDYGIPNKTLLLQTIPASVTEDTLRDMFEDIDGFVDARVFKVKNVGFLDFEDVAKAQNIIDWVAEQQIGDVSYAKV